MNHIGKCIDYYDFSERLIEDMIDVIPDNTSEIGDEPEEIAMEFYGYDPNSN